LAEEEDGKVSQVTKDEERRGMRRERSEVS
jgi:hypothetical protein